MKWKLLIIAALLWVSTQACAAERIIELADGSKIRGDVVSMADDSFTVRTRSLGTITLPASQIVSMRAPGASDPQNPVEPKVSKSKPSISGGTSGSIASLAAGLTSNTELMSSVMALRHDPQMKAILADPKLMKAVQDLDFDTLAKDPRIQALMSNPGVKQIETQVHQ